MKKKTENFVMLLGGGAIGFINGFFGGGGGMLCVPLYNKILKRATKQSHATAIAVILPISIASAITYIIGGSFDLKSALITSAGVVAGGIAGALLLKKLNSAAVAVIFALIMIAAGVKLAVF